MLAEMFKLLSNYMQSCHRELAVDCNTEQLNAVSHTALAQFNAVHTEQVISTIQSISNIVYYVNCGA